MKTSRFINRLFSFLNRKLHISSDFFYTLFENIYLNLIGVTIGNKCRFIGWTSVYLADGSSISIGKNCCFSGLSSLNPIGINHKCIIATHTSQAKLFIGDNLGVTSSTINCWDSVTIGNNVRIGANSIIMDSDFHLEDPRVGHPKPIRICDGVWLGANVVVMKGVQIGENSIIGMNSVVTKDIPSNSVAVGNPCKVVKSL